MGDKMLVTWVFTWSLYVTSAVCNKFSVIPRRSRDLAFFRLKHGVYTNIRTRTVRKAPKVSSLKNQDKLISDRVLKLYHEIWNTKR